MAHALKIRPIGNSLGVILPRAVLTALNLRAGDSLILTEAPDGFRVTPDDGGFGAAMAAFEHTRRKYRNAFHELAK